MKKLLLTVATGVLLVSCSGEKKAELPQESKPKAQAPQTTKPVAAQTDTAEFRLLGQVSSQDKILLSFKGNGIIRKIYVKAGMQVKEGQLLADLDDAQLKLRADSAKLQLDKAVNQLEQSERDFKIEKELREKDISSLTQFQNAELTYKNAVIAKNLADVELRTARQALEDARLIAPDDGTISQQLKFAGDKSDGVTFEMFAASDPEIHFSAPESFLSKLSVGTKLDISFPSIDLNKRGRIVRIVPAVRENDRSFLVVAKLLEQDKRIVPGIFAEATVSANGK